MFPDSSEVGKYFHEMFKFRWDEYRRSSSLLVVNPTKRRKKFAEEEGLIYKPLDFEIFGNISAFGIFEISRLAVFEKFLRRTSYLYLHLQMLTEPPPECSSPADSELVAPKLRTADDSDVSKVVKIGVRGVFELIKGSKDEHPNLCIKAVNSLLTLLEGLQLEALSDEPSDIINDIFNVLLSVVNESLSEKSTDPNHHVNRLVELSSASLLSFAIIRGDTGKMLRAICTILTSKYSTSHKMILPNAVIELQKSVQSIITGKLKHPSWFTHGVQKSSCISSFRLLLASDNLVKVPLRIKNVACDGYFLYIYCTYGLYKVGTGYNGTIPRNIYAYNAAFFGQENGWIGFIKKTLYFVLNKPKCNYEFYAVNTSTLELQNMLRVDVSVVNLNRGPLFVNDEYLCLLSSLKEDTLILRHLEINETKVALSPEDMHLKLSQKYFKLFGSAFEGQESVLCQSTVGISEEIVSFVCGKEFSFLQTADGKVLYNGKLGNQNIRVPGSKIIQCWVELMCPKMSAVRQCVTGNEGSIGLLVYSDGSVYSIGIAKRGEDGENGVPRRQSCQVKPKRMTRMEGKNVTYAACNHGSTALVTDKGELYMFGKDAIHCEPGTGLVSDLKNVKVRLVALGKVHVVVLTDKGHVYTFGYNGRGQCGRYFSSSDSNRFENQGEIQTEDEETVGSSEETYSDFVCPKGTHVFKQDKCMICPICHQCTGYGAECQLARRNEEREPGEECGCGDGDSGCAKCCICKLCAFEEDPEQELDDDNDVDDLIKINLFGAVYERNDRKARAEFFKRDDATPTVTKENRISGTEVVANANILGGDSMSMVYLPPAKVFFKTNSLATQIAAGLYHSVVLMENGEVYTFGSNAMGQLGVADVNNVGPVRANLPSVIVQIAAGSNHTVALSSTGEVYTFGSNSKSQLGDHVICAIENDGLLWSNVPLLVPEIGAQYQKKAVGIGASGDLTYLKINENFVNVNTLNVTTFVADKNHILLLPVRNSNNQKPFDCVVVEKVTNNFKSFQNEDQVDFSGCFVCYDSYYNVLWSVKFDENDSFDQSLTISCYNVIASDVREEFCSPNILDCELAVPIIPLRLLPCYQTAIHVLACLDMLAQARSSKDALKSFFTEQKRVVNTRSLRKEDFSFINRFQGLGNMWTYNTHNAVEAIRVSCDTDVLLGGVGLYGGRGHYHAKIKIFDLGFECDSQSKEGQLLLSTDEIVYECSLKQIYSFMLEEPILLQANRWYVIWAQIKGSPSDYGASGQSYIVTDDEVVFHFKSCLLSNNGTDVSCGQIPQLLYKLLQPEFFVVTNFENPSSSAAVHILSRKFSHSVSEDGFRSLIDLLSWCWEAFKKKYSEISNVWFSPALLESVRQFDRLVYINQACHHLIRTFIFETYPEDSRVREKRTRNNYIMAELIGDVRELLQNILSDPFIFENFILKKADEGSNNIFFKLVKHILKECSDTLVSCFYVFYPSPIQKWIHLGYLLNFEPENEFENDFLIIATLSALYASNIHLKAVFPILLGGFDPNLLFQQNKKANVSTSCFHNFYPVLTENMMARTEREIPVTVCSWLFIVEKILEMASQPLRDILRGAQKERDSKIAYNSCHILSKLVAELSAEAMGINDEVQRRKEQMLHTTPVRFRRINGNKSWNTGNGSPDAISFSVNKPGVVIVGVGVFGGSGNYDYEIELMDEGCNRSKNGESTSSSHTPWRCIAMCRGSFGTVDYNGKDVVELNFEYPATIRENTKYVIKLRLRGNRTNNGELGQAVITGPDETVFTFSSTDMSFNGTSVSRGQLPYIIYYRYPQRSTQELKQKISLENQAREAIITISKLIFGRLRDVLLEAKELGDHRDVIDALIDTPFIKVLIPLLVTHLSPLITLHPKNAFQVFKFIEELLPLVCSLNKERIMSSRESAQILENSFCLPNTSNICTTSPHYSVVESDHPYKRATVSMYNVKFPQSVLWMSLEFDPRCGTTQEEDVLKIYVPDFAGEQSFKPRKLFRPLPRVYGNIKNSWPGTAIILPGNEVIFSLESASKYSSHDRGTPFGFKCSVIGFELVNIDELPRLELELTTLACRCASYLIKKKRNTSLVEDELNVENLNMESAEAEYRAHPRILNRGLDLFRDEIMEHDWMNMQTRFNRPQLTNDTNGCASSDADRLDSTGSKFLGSSVGSNERLFLADFINYRPETSGGRLARWLQPDSFVEVNKCEVILPRAKIKCGWPTSLAIVTRDQYGDIVEVPDLKVNVECLPLTKNCVAAEEQNGDADGEKKIDFSVPYKPVIVNQVRYNAIIFMKEFANLSFEEIRFMTPSTHQEGEKLSVVANHNGIYTATWTPKEIGFYSILVSIDGYPMNEVSTKIEVKMPPHGAVPPPFTKSTGSSYHDKKLQFSKKSSAGLRVRAQPSLQSEQIGIIMQEAVVTYVDEFENEDGFWIKLSHDSIAQYCKQLFSEAWCLRYNKHYECEMLSSFTGQTSESQTEKVVTESEVKIYKVVKCGVSGHNVRAYPSLKAPTVGMIYAEQKVTSDEQIYNKEGMWIKLDKEAMKTFDLTQYENVWSLAVDKSQIVYLRSDFTMNKDMFLNALKWDALSNKITQSQSICNTSTSEDSDNDHNHNYFIRTTRRKVVPPSSKEDAHTIKKPSTSRGSKNVTPSRKAMEADVRSNTSNNQNLNFSMPPPTPKKQRRTTSIVEIEKSQSTCSSCVAEFNDSSFSSSSSDSVGSSERSHFYSFIDKLEKRNEPVIIGVSTISDKSSAISSGYQASIDTSSDSVLIFKPDPFVEQEPPPTLAQACTQTSPKLLPKMAHFSRLSPDIRDAKVDQHNNANLKVDSSPKLAARVHDSVENVLDEAILQVEASEQALVAAASRRFEKYVTEASPKNLRMSQSTESAGASKFNDTMNNLIELQDINVFKVQLIDAKSEDPPVDSVSRPKIRPNSKRKFDSLLAEKPTTIGQREDVKSSETAPEKDAKKIKYKTGMSPSAAESIRAVFAAFLWHEGLVHDAMTCASFLRFYPELVKDRSVVVRRVHSSKPRNPSQRYSVEVGLTGNAHHLIKPSSMGSLPSVNRSTPPSANANGEPIKVPQVPPMTLEHVSTLWNEISNTCLQLFSRGSVYSTATYKVADFKTASEVDRGKTLASKFANDFYTKFATEDICELCNEKFPFPVTSHMSNAHTGCGKAGVSRAYNVNGKYNLKVEGYCGDGGRKNSPWYILCETCREQFLHAKTLKTNLCPVSSPAPDDSAACATPIPSSGIHLILKENASFAMDLSGNYDKLTPAVSNLPNLKSFSCLASFGIEGESIPNEMSSLTFETEEQRRNKEENVESDNDEAVNVVHNFQRSVSRIGRKWKSSEDNNLPSPEIPSKRFTVCEFDDSNLPEINHSSTKLKSILQDIHTKSSSSIMDRPIMAFLCKYHNLQCLKSAMKLIIRNAIYKNFGLKAFDWLLHTVTAPMALHDIMWWFVASFSIPLPPEDDYPEGEWNDEFDLTRICEHPLVDMALAGEATQHIPSSFHTLLQTIADLMLIFPVGSPLQQMAIKCWGFRFAHSDYSFLHRSKLFVNISKILSRSESEEEQEYCSSMYESHPSTVSQSGHYVEVLRDVTPHISLTVSSQPHLILNLTDNSTETYWESSEEDRRKMKTIVINSPAEVSPYVIYIHVDNTRDTNHKVSSIMILTGTHVDNPRKLRNINLDADYCGWVTTFIPEPNQRMIRVDCKGDAILRVRQVKVSGELKGESPRILQMPCSVVLQQRQCESETLKVFRLIIFQVFGELIENCQSDAQQNSVQRGSSDLKEHMVGILFSRRKLNNLQKQVCTHIVQTIKRETCVIREEWERHINSMRSCLDNVSGIISDSYCFEMLCMVSALSGTDVGRSYLAQQLDLISDLLVLLHVGTTRLQRQVILLLKRVLPEVTPEKLAHITGVHSLPAIDFRALASKMTSSLDAEKCGILDIFLSVIAKILCVQVKAKNGSNGKDVKMVVMSDFVSSQDVDSTKWYLKGNMSRELAAEVDCLMKDMSKGKISDAWQEITKAAIAENILNLANLSKLTKDHKECLKYPTFWIGLASLSIVDGDHVEKLSSANWRNDNGSSVSPRPLCANHDDGKTAAVIQCNVCGLLCLECDRFLHLNRKTSHHERRVCKEEEEAIKVDVHEGCGRVKLFWLLALVDSNTFKGVVEFRENSRLLGLANRDGIDSEMCRFCGRPSDKSLGNVCCDEECQQHATNACNKVHRCGHLCGGIKDEENCLPCLHGCSSTDASLKQDADDMCMICFTEALSGAPSIQLECGHVFHYNCCQNVLERRWAGPRITFNFQQCPICKRSMHHDSMRDLLSPIWDLMKEVRKKALMRLEYEGCPSTYEDPAVYAMEKYAYYVCFKCKKAYYGGEARCEADVDNSDYNPEELICGGCSDISGARVCPKHGTDFLEYKCRYCCSVAVYFCFGTTHFCNACHEDFQKVISMLPSELPACPAGPKGIALNVEDCPLHIKHPPTGEEFALGCGVCRTGRNF